MFPVSFKEGAGINQEHYRKIVLDKGTFEDSFGTPGIYVRANPEIWNSIKQKVPPNMESYLRGYSLNGIGETRPWKWRVKGNHPLVENCIGFWMDERTIITGYNLIHNPEIYRPIFQPWKEILNNQLRIEIRYYAKFIVADMRQTLYKKTLLSIRELDILPDEIIHKIAHFTYDPKYYLKL